jgi:hypothetical protein
MQKKDPLKTYEMEHARAEQLADNCRWLIGITDAINRELCPIKIGTWQQRAEYALEAAQEINRVRFEREQKKIKKRTEKFINEIELAHKRAGKSKLIFKKRSKA